MSADNTRRMYADGEAKIEKTTSTLVGFANIGEMSDPSNMQNDFSPLDKLPDANHVNNAVNSNGNLCHFTDVQNHGGDGMNGASSSNAISRSDTSPTDGRPVDDA